MDRTSGETASDRRIFQITGADALPFLQGLTSNDVLPMAKAPGIVWTALLTPQGKYLADFFVVNTGPADALPDPRHEALGWRAYRSLGGTPQIDWDAIRVAHVIPESAIELIPDDSYLLENGFERLHGVNFRKGCYLGQEVTARMKHKTELRKGLTRVTIDGQAPVGTDVLAAGKVVGRLFTQSRTHVLAHLRLDQAKGIMTAGSARITLD